MTRRGRRAATRTVVVHVGPLAPPATGASPLGGDSVMPQDTPARAGFVVGRSVARSAVVRNRVTRRLRHIAAARLDELPDGTGLVIRARPPAATATAGELTSDVLSALQRCLSRVGRDPVPASAVSP